MGEAGAGSDTTSPSQDVKQSFWIAHAGALLSLAGVVAAAMIAGIVAVVGTVASSWQQERSGHLQYQSDLVLRALEPDEVDKREEQLRFLLDTRLLTDEEIREGLTAYLNGENDLPQFEATALDLDKIFTQAQQSQVLVNELDCHPSYDPCVPNAADVDCLGGAGDGPGFAYRVKEVGADVFELDADGDGTGCE